MSGSRQGTRVARREDGFTLLELVIALSLLALMAAVLAGSVSLSAKSWDGGETKAAEVSEMRQAQEFLLALGDHCGELLQELRDLVCDEGEQPHDQGHDQGDEEQRHDDHGRGPRDAE